VFTFNFANVIQRKKQKMRLQGADLGSIPVLILVTACLFYQTSAQGLV